MRGGAGVPNRALRRGLFERSEFPSHLDSGRRRRHPGEPASEQGRRGRVRANMVLGTFAETQVPRRAGGETPHTIKGTSKNRPFP